MKNNWTMVFDHDDLFWPEHYTEEDKFAVELNLAFGFPDEYGFVDGHAPEYTEDDDDSYDSSTEDDPQDAYDDDEYEEEFYDDDDDDDEAVLGDEMEGREGQYGIVVGQIRNRFGKIVCYKVCRRMSEEDDVGEFDYINVYDVSLSEPCGNTTWSLGRIGYRFVEDERMRCGGYYINDKTGDVIYARRVMR